MVQSCMISGVVVLLLFCEAIARSKIERTCQKKIHKDICNQNYNYTLFPNLLGHKTQEEAYEHYKSHLYAYPLVLLGCHEDLEQFLCLLYFPSCDPDSSHNEAYLPCKNMCVAIRKVCEPTVQSYGQFSWGFPCELYPDTGECVLSRRDIHHLDMTVPPPTEYPARITCRQDQFQCSDNLRCIPLQQRCDGLVDCVDMSDEKVCGYCSSNAFRCANGKCINQLQVCDGFDNCGDNSDEVNCERNNLIQKLINDMLTCDCSNTKASVPSYTDICTTTNILKVVVTGVKENNVKYRYKVRVEGVLKGEKMLKGKRATYEIMKVDSCKCKKDIYRKGELLFVSGLISFLKTKKQKKIRSINISNASVGSFTIPTNMVDRKSLKSQIKDCYKFSKNFSRSTTKIRIRQAKFD